MILKDWSYTKYSEHEYEWKKENYIISVTINTDSIRITAYDDSRPFGKEPITKSIAESKYEAYQIVKAVAEDIT